MKILYIHRHCTIGGVESGIRRKCLGLKKLGIDVDFLFLEDLGGRSIFSDLNMNLYHANDNDEIERIIDKK